MTDADKKIENYLNRTGQAHVKINNFAINVMHEFGLNHADLGDILEDLAIYFKSL